MTCNRIRYYSNCLNMNICIQTKVALQSKYFIIISLGNVWKFLGTFLLQGGLAGTMPRRPKWKLLFNPRFWKHTQLRKIQFEKSLFSPVWNARCVATWWRVIIPIKHCRGKLEHNTMVLASSIQVCQITCKDEFLWI